MLIQNKTVFTSDPITKKTNVGIPLYVYLRGNAADNDVLAGTVSILVLGEDNIYHSYTNTVFNENGVGRVFLHANAVYKVDIDGFTNAVDVEIR